MRRNPAAQVFPGQIQMEDSMLVELQVILLSMVIAALGALICFGDDDDDDHDDDDHSGGKLIPVPVYQEQ